MVKRFSVLCASMLAAALGVLVLAVLLAGPAPAQAAPATTYRYVSPAGCDWCSYWGGWYLNDCTVSANPCRTIQNAIARAEPFDTIYVAQGTYTGIDTAVVIVTKSITLYGGWDESFTTRDPEQYPTVLDGERERRVVYVSGDITPTIDGFIITHGDGTGLTEGCTGASGSPSGCGGGIFVDDAHPIISNNIITDNVASISSTNTGYGGGIYLHNADRAVVSGNLIVSNTACVACLGNGGGIGSVYADGITVYGNRVLSNVARISGSGSAWGGGIALTHGSGTVEQNEVTGNWAHGAGTQYGGGIHQWYGSYTIRNNRVKDNHGEHAVFLGYSKSMFEANEVVGNEATYAVELRYGEAETPRLINNVIAGSQNGVYAWATSGFPLTAHLIHNTLAGLGGTTGYGVRVGSYTTLYLTNTMVVSFSTGTFGNVFPDHTLFWANDSNGVVGTNPVYGDPTFLAPGNSNYHIRADSAARDAGIDVGVTTDIDGDSRPEGLAPDIGADEFAWNKVYLPLVLRGY